MKQQPKKVFLTDKQAGSALLGMVMGAEITIARLKKKLKDREERLRYVNRRAQLGGVESLRNIENVSDLKIRNWRGE